MNIFYEYLEKTKNKEFNKYTTKYKTIEKEHHKHLFLAKSVRWKNPTGLLFRL